MILIGGREQLFDDAVLSAAHFGVQGLDEVAEGCGAKVAFDAAGADADGAGFGVAGADDQATPPDLVQSMSQLITGAAFTCYDNVGHLPCIEAPERIARDIQTHMAALT